MITFHFFSLFTADVLSCTASILNLCAISVDRYQAITRPLEYSSVSSPRRMLAVIFAVWLSAACVSLPPLLLLGNEHTNQDCAVSQNFWYDAQLPVFDDELETLNTKSHFP